MKLEGFKIHLKREIEERWEEKRRILEDTYNRKTDGLKKRYETIKKDVIANFKNKLGKIEENFQQKLQREKLKLISELEDSFCREIQNEMKEWFLSQEGEREIIKYIKAKEDEFNSGEILLGKNYSSDLYENGDFELGFKVFFLDKGTEYDYSDEYLLNRIEEIIRIYLDREVLNENT